MFGKEQIFSKRLSSVKNLKILFGGSVLTDSLPDSPSATLNEHRLNSHKNSL
jgi:hypothetical protein